LTSGGHAARLRAAFAAIILALAARGWRLILVEEPPGA